MSKLNNELLKQALEIVAQEEFESIDKAPSFTPSQEFEDKMQKLIKNASKPYYKFTATGMRRAICIFAAVFLLMLSTLSVSAIRDTVSNVFGRVFSSSFNSANKKQNDKKKFEKPETTTKENVDKSKENNKNSAYETIDDVYEIGLVPEGYELVVFDSTGYEITTTYSSSINKIILKQFLKDSYEFDFNRQEAEKSVVVLNNQEYKIYTHSNNSECCVFWKTDEFAFTLSCSTEFTQDELLEMCLSVRIKQENNYPQTLLTFYELGAVPEEFSLVEFTPDSGSIVYNYVSGDKTIRFIQSIKPISVDIETGATKWLESHDDKVYTVYNWGYGYANSGYYYVVYEGEEYDFSVYSNLSKNEVIDLVKSIRQIEEKNFPKKIKKVYGISGLPDGFGLLDLYKEECQVTTTYSAPKDFIELKQYTKDTYTIGVDIVNATKKTETIDELEFVVYEFNNGDVMLVWETDDYIFSIRSSLEKQQIAPLCKDLKKQKVESAVKPTTTQATTTTKSEVDSIETVYELGFVPNGTELVDYDVDTNTITYVYSLNSETVVFVQSTKTAYNSSVDKSTAKKETKTYNGKQYAIYSWETGEINVVWNDGDYVFDLYGKLNKTDVFKMCNSLKVKEN